LADYGLTIKFTNFLKKVRNSYAKNESTYKPGPVKDSHSSRTYIAACLKQPTRVQREPRLNVKSRLDERTPIWSCSEWGLPCRSCYH